MAEEATCSALSSQVGEPLSGTAVAETDLWLVLEHPGPWGPKGLEDSCLPPALVALLGAFLARQPRARVQLIRQPERAGSLVRLFLARADPAAQRLHRLELNDYAALAALDLDAWAAGTPPAAAKELPGPLYLVCVHGKRDRCCAQRGMPVYSALSALEGDDVWQTTHLGGHRFAATLLVLPAGICYGRLEPEEAAPLAIAHARGELYDVARLRGRCAYGSAAQAAEIALRAELGERRLDAFELLAEEQAEGPVRVRFLERARQREHELSVEQRPLPPAPASCGAAPKPGQQLVALRRLT